MKRSGTAVWQGKLNQGHGRLTTQSRALADARYSFTTRFGDQAGTNPEELIAAAHAGCFSMALAFFLENAGLTPERIETRAELTVQLEQAGWTVTGVHLHVVASVPDADDAQFQRVSEQAKTGCLVSRLLNAPVTMQAELEPQREQV